MKKLVLILICAMLFTIAESSAQTKMVSTNDTSLTAGTIYKMSKDLGAYNAVGVSAVFEKTSGTVGGYAYLEGTIDGTNYYILTDSLTIANSSGKQKKRWNFTSATPLQKVRATVVNTGGAFTTYCWYIKQ